MVNEKPTISEISWSGKKLGFFKSWFSSRGARSEWRPRGRRSATAVQDAGREQRRARRLGSDAFGDKGARKQATSTVPLSTRVNARSTVPGREANKLNVDDVES